MLSECVHRLDHHRTSRATSTPRCAHFAAIEWPARCAESSLQSPHARSGLHEATWRGVLSRELGHLELVRLDAAPVDMRALCALVIASWRIADEFGCAKTYGAFFFSSRRRHTRSLCDWSSDVCSSD